MEEDIYKRIKDFADNDFDDLTENQKRELKLKVDITDELLNLPITKAFFKLKTASEQNKEFKIISNEIVGSIISSCLLSYCSNIDEALLILNEIREFIINTDKNINKY